MERRLVLRHWRARNCGVERADDAPSGSCSSSRPCSLLAVVSFGLNGRGYQVQSADRRRLRVYARVLRLPVLLVDAAAARRRGGRFPAADARHRGRGRRGRPEGHFERHRSDHDHSYGHPSRAAGIAACQGREDHRARGASLSSRCRDTRVTESPRQVSQCASLQVTLDTDQTKT